MSEETDAFALPSTFINRFQAHASPTTVRIAFAEGPATSPTYHLAITMLTSDARALIELLTRLIETAETKQPRH